MYEVNSSKQVVKIKSNAGKHIGVSPSVFYISPGERRELSGFRFLEESFLVTVKPANVDALIIEKATMNKENKGCVWLGSMMHRFKLQFNTLEISEIFYDKIRTVSDRDFLDIINKRVTPSSLSLRVVEHVEEGKDQAEYSSCLPCLYPTPTAMSFLNPYILPRPRPPCLLPLLLFYWLICMMNRHPSMKRKMEIPSPSLFSQFLTIRKQRITQCRTS